MAKALNINASSRELVEQYEKYKSSGKQLDMSRGKPATEQLDNLSALLTQISKNSDCYSENGIDCRNYGYLEGIPEAKKMFAQILEVNPENVVVCGNSSLNIMYDTISNGYIYGFNGEKPWCKQDKIKFLCPSPGYDRHFAITSLFGFEQIVIPMTSEGPDMDLVRQYAENDPAVKGIWCVPKYSNPTGVTFSEKVVKEFAALKPAANDFIVMWDNAYAVHDLNGTTDKLISVMKEAEERGTQDLFYIFTSTSKISWSGAGISCVAMSFANKERFLKIMGVKTIGYDKLAMLRHARMVGANLPVIMAKHAKIIKPKFDLCFKYFAELKKDIEGFEYSTPNGGYFINVNVPAGKAKRVVSLAAEAGLKLTPAGATFPGGFDPEDKNIRIAPTYPTLDELDTALRLFSICVRLA